MKTKFTSAFSDSFIRRRGRAVQGGEGGPHPGDLGPGGAATTRRRIIRFVTYGVQDMPA